MTPVNTITFVGAGNAGTHLAKALHSAGYKINQVYSHTEIKAQALAEDVNCPFTSTLDELDVSSDLIFLAIRDDAIPGVADFIGEIKSVVVHIAGSVPLTALSGAGENTGVFYPLQSFTRDREVNYKNIPILLESSNEKTRIRLFQVASKISEKIYFLDSERRRKLHIAAIFVNNFSNSLLNTAEEMVQDLDLPLNILRPLAEETVAKAFDLMPHNAQTGPAARGEKLVIQRHLRELKAHPKWQQIYGLFSKLILEKKPRN